MMAGEKARKLYTERAQLYRRLFIDVLGWERTLRRFFESTSYLRPNMKILDAGCGTGAVTRSLYLVGLASGISGLQFRAFDLTPAMLDMFREWLEEQKIRNVELLQADVLRLDQQLPRDWHEFDMIVSAAMLEYVPTSEIEPAIDQLRKRIKPGGVLLLFLTRRNVLTNWLGRAWWGTNTFDEEEIRDALKQTGFHMVRAKSLVPPWSAYLMVAEARR